MRSAMPAVVTSSPPEAARAGSPSGPGGASSAATMAAVTVEMLMRSIALAAALLLSNIGRAEPLPDADYAALARAVIDQVVIPAYTEYARATQRLDPAIERHCMGTAPADVAAIHSAFGKAMDGWQRAWPFSFGPVMHDAGRARIAFWPDRRGSAARQMRTVLRNRDEALLDAKALAGKSVAIKDLQALERLLFAAPRDAYTCGLSRAIARHQSEIAAEVLDAWTREGGFRQTALDAGGDNDRYADDAEVARDLMRSLTESLDVIVTRKLEAPLGESVAKARPKRSESRRSGRSLRNVVMNLETMRAMVETPGGFADLVAAHGDGALADDLRSGFAGAVSKAAPVNQPLREAVSDPEERAKLLDLLRSLRALRALVSGPLSRATGILVGFNAQDGD